MALKILNWNVWCDNNDLDKIVEFITAHNADVICLQEVSEELLNKLKRCSPYTLVYALDYSQIQNNKKMDLYLVILSRRKIHAYKIIKFKKHPVRRNLIARLWGIKEGIEFHYIDIFVGQQKNRIPIRIFNAHLDCAVGPKLRIGRFSKVLRHRDKKYHNIICGDLNVFRSWFSWGWRVLLGSWDELWTREYELFERMFEKRKFTNVFKGKATHVGLFSGDSQFDYIIVSNDLVITRHTLFEDTHGSDHKPMLIELQV